MKATVLVGGLFLSWLWTVVDADFEPRIDHSSQSQLFEPPEEIRVNGPAQFPKPTRLLDDNATVIVKPTFGEHRPDVDAVMAYAEGYTLQYYIMFIKTLRETGFDGDIVLAIAYYPFLANDVEDYLRAQQHVVVYIHELKCYLTTDNVTPSPRIMKRGHLDVFQMCHLPNVYGWTDADGNVLKVAPDPRIGRAVATLRYEWYWIWSLQYNTHSWLMLLDARDSFFQTNPFVNLPRSSNQNNGWLYFFGENAEATRLGRSTKNMNWLRGAYGMETLGVLAQKPTICSGSTMGEQIAIETYLRAMVNEWDTTDIRMTGADQGFHNYLWYSRKLHNAETIREIVVWEQGKGIINNLGALRTKPLVDWGIYNNETYQVYNWDGTLSPVAHQWDRDNHLHNWMVRSKHIAWKQEYQRHKQQKQQS